MTRVLLISRPVVPPWDEASKNFTRNLALHPAGLKLAVLTDGSAVDLPPEVDRIPIYSKPRLSRWQRARLLGLWRYARRFDVHHYLFTPNRLNTLVFGLTLGRLGAKSVQTIASLNGREYTQTEMRKLMFADVVVTYSEYSRRRLEEAGVARTERIYPGIDLEAFSPRSRDEPMAAAWGIERDDFVVLYPGEYYRLGATDMLVESMAEAVRRMPTLKFIFGCRVKHREDPRKKREVVAAIEARGPARHVIYTDTVRDMPALYNLADVVAFPILSMSLKFDVPLAVVEAMACAKPLVISDLPLLAEFSSSQNAVVVPAGDAGAYLDAIEALANDPKRRASLGKQARAFAEKEFDIRQISARYAQVYSSLGAKGQGGT